MGGSNKEDPPMKFEIPRCYDSHIHLLATGQLASMLELNDVRDPRHINTKKIKPEYYRQEWLLGFGWDQFQFVDQKMPTRQDLDFQFPNTPVAFSRIDGHAVWVNSHALELCGLLTPVHEWNLPGGAYAEADANGFAKGVLVDRAMEKIFSYIPQDSILQKKKDLIVACKKFNQNGFTHVRDMSGDPAQWQALCELEAEGQLSLYIEQNFVFEKEEDVETIFELAIRAKKESHQKLRANGIKFYIDGALGSDGAWLSQNYPGSDSHGLKLWSKEQVVGWILRAWQNNLEVSVHTIGDEASYFLATCAREVWSKGILGHLNFEHAEVVRPETLQLIQGMSVTFHIQPCHWLSDRKWLKHKLGDLYQYAFPWSEVVKNKFQLCWGSDSPIEKPSLFANQLALLESAKDGIPNYAHSWEVPHIHPDKNWGAECRTIVDTSTKEICVYINEKQII